MNLSDTFRGTTELTEVQFRTRIGMAMRRGDADQMNDAAALMSLRQLVVIVISLTLSRIRQKALGFTKCSWKTVLQRQGQGVILMK